MLNRDKSDHFCKVCKKSFLEIDKPDTCTCGKPNEPQLSAEMETTAWDFSDIEKEAGDILLQGDSYSRLAKTTYLYDKMLLAFSKRLDSIEKKHKKALATALEEQREMYESKIKAQRDYVAVGDSGQDENLRQYIRGLDFTLSILNGKDADAK